MLVGDRLGQDNRIRIRFCPKEGLSFSLVNVDGSSCHILSGDQTVKLKLITNEVKSYKPYYEDGGDRVLLNNKDAHEVVSLMRMGFADKIAIIDSWGGETHMNSQSIIDVDINGAFLQVYSGPLEDIIAESLKDKNAGFFYCLMDAM